MFTNEPVFDKGPCVDAYLYWDRTKGDEGTRVKVRKQIDRSVQQRRLPPQPVQPLAAVAATAPTYVPVAGAANDRSLAIPSLAATLQFKRQEMGVRLGQSLFCAKRPPVSEDHEFVFRLQEPQSQRADTCSRGDNEYRVRFAKESLKDLAR